MKNKYNFPVEWWETTLASVLFTALFMALDWITIYNAFEKGFVTTVLFEQMQLSGSVAVIVAIIDITPTLAGSIISKHFHLKKSHMKKAIFLLLACCICLCILTIFAKLFSSSVSILQTQQASETSDFTTLLTQGSVASPVADTDITTAKMKVAWVGNLTTGLMPIFTSVFLLVMSMAATKTHKRMQLCDRLKSLQKKREQLVEKQEMFSELPSAEEYFKSDENMKQAMLTRIQVYFITWQRSNLIPLAEKFGNPYLTSEMLANPEVNNIKWNWET